MLVTEGKNCFTKHNDHRRGESNELCSESNVNVSVLQRSDRCWNTFINLACLAALVRVQQDASRPGSIKLPGQSFSPCCCCCCCRGWWRRVGQKTISLTPGVPCTIYRIVCVVCLSARSRKRSVLCAFLSLSKSFLLASQKPHTRFSDFLFPRIVLSLGRRKIQNNIQRELFMFRVIE